MESIGQILQRMASGASAHATVIICLFTGETLPASCAPMLRQPAPKTGMLFDSTFPEVHAHAIAQNSAAHDGAVMVGRTTGSDPYRIVGWSFRLFPSAQFIEPTANRGSAFNSALAMSLVAIVDSVYLLSGKTIYRFHDGTTSEVPSSRA
jgi:hypothetical protein